MAASSLPDIFDEDLISLEEVSTWDIQSLKDYCKRRGYKVSGTKSELCARVYMLYNQQVPEEPGAKERETALKNDYKTIFRSGIPAPDPAKLKSWKDEKTSIKQWPPISYVEIAKFIAKKGCSFSKETLTAYKTGKAYSYFYNDWLKQVYFHPINKSNEACFLKAECTPSNRLNDPPHNVWIKANKHTGDIYSAFCSCVAGYSETCNHVAALLFKLEFANRLDLSNEACTAALCTWNVPSVSTKQLTLQPVKEMIFKKPSYKNGKDTANVKSSCSKADFNFRDVLVESSDAQPFQTLINELRKALPQALIFLPGTRRSKPNPDSEFVANPVEIGEQCRTVEELIGAISLSAEDRKAIEERTRQQSKCEEWKKLRKGRITASNFYKVYTKVETVKKKPTTDCMKLINLLIDPPDLSHLPHIIKGIRDESKAVQSFIKLMSENHLNVRVHSCGLFIHKENPYLGATPDGLAQCDCCEDKYLIEIKCPTRELSQLPYLHQNKLKNKSNYYGQVQGQMAVTGIKKTFFYIYYTDTEFFIEEICYDDNFIKAMLNNLEIFYRQFMAPYLLSCPTKKLKKHI